MIDNITTFCFIGLGLMGGSIAQSIRQNFSSYRILGSDIERYTLECAKKEGVLDDFYLPSEVDKMLSISDVVFVCLYPHDAADFIIKHQAAFKSNSIVTDISGVKSIIVKKLDDFSRTDVDIILGHPMAGSEREGYAHACAKMFYGRNYIFIKQPDTKQANIDFLEKLARIIGFTRIIETTPEIHDHKIAFTSQLCHVIASALVNSAEDTKITEFGGGSFEDLTRIAMINAPLWTELFLSNRNELLNHISAFEKSLSQLKFMIQQSDEKSLCAYLSDVRETRLKMI